MGRLIKAKGGVAAGGTGVANWTQDYAFDRYGNKTTTTKSGVTADSAAIPLDGLASQSFDAATNRITTANHEYDNAGNQTKGKAPDGTIQRFEFDEAGRIVKIKTDAGADIETNTYGTSRERLLTDNGSLRTYYAWGGSSVLCEYTETGAGVVPNWAKSYIYAGSRLLSTITKNGSSELTEFQHPDRLGTKAISDTTANTFEEQATLPFGTMIVTETEADTNQKFTSYDRSEATGLDYAVNRTYNSGQSRFTQVDPIGMAAENRARMYKGGDKFVEVFCKRRLTQDLIKQKLDLAQQSHYLFIPFMLRSAPLLRSCQNPLTRAGFGNWAAHEPG